MSIASWTSPPASAFTLPISRVIRSESSGLALLEQLREAEQDVAALRRRHEPPVLPRRARGRDRALDVVGVERGKVSITSPVDGFRDSNVVVAMPPS